MGAKVPAGDVAGADAADAGEVAGGVQVAAADGQGKDPIIGAEREAAVPKLIAGQGGRLRPARAWDRRRGAAGA